MNNSKTKSKNTKAMLLIFLGWIVYTTSYLGKVNYSANITQIIDFYGVSKAQAGAAPTMFFFAYGIGQVINGLFCKKYRIKWMIFGSLMTSAIINLTVAVTTDFSIIKWLWLINGAALSILWPSLIRLMSESIPKKKLSISTVVMGTTVAGGTLIIYGLSSVYAAFDRFKLSFYTAAFAVMAVAILWLCLYNKAVKDSVSEKDAEDETSSAAPASAGKRSANGRYFLTTFGILCFCSVGINLVKDGLTTWVPSILKDEFSMSDSLSILLTLFLPILAVFGNAFAIKVHKRVPDYVSHCAGVFAVICIIIGGVVGGLALKAAAAVIVGLVLANFLASSLNSLTTSIFPLFMREQANSGFLAGMLNGFCYLGSTISSYGLGVVADNFGWNGVFFVLMGFCVLVLLIWIAYAASKKLQYNKGITK